ncbi:glucosaminidase domain-containing protein [bacterium]|nr:glucosaminidase domain-containing protein [bacterium]
MSNAIRKGEQGIALPARRKAPAAAAEGPQAQPPRLARDLLRLSSQASSQPQHRFIQEMHAAALKIERQTGLPAPVILAQAALESNWGRAAIGRYNVFGIKGEGSKGSIKVATREYVNGKAIRTFAEFAHFASFEEAFAAYAKLIHNGKHPRAVAAKSDPQRYAKALQGTYATDPGYGRKLIQIMRSQGLL